jgi:hypothetical protein
MPTTTKEDKQAYCSCMEQVKRRLALVRKVANGEIQTGDADANAEFICFQLRRILELIAFATLAANRDRYSQIRNDVENEWRSKHIFKKLREINPDFYPVPVIPTHVAPNTWHFDLRADGFLTEAEFFLLYDKCSEAVHEWNPFRTDVRLIDFELSLMEWATRIENLLEFHRIRLVDQSDILLVRLSDPKDGKSYVLTGTPQPEP